jgi:hypothetical protein
LLFSLARCSPRSLTLTISSHYLFIDTAFVSQFWFALDLILFFFLSHPHIRFFSSSSFAQTSTFEDVDSFATLGETNELDFPNLENWKSNFDIKIISAADDKVVFDLIGVDAPIANALRRIMIAEVPTMAIEKVLLYQNTSVIQDEVLSHRLGLIPIQADPRMFKYLYGTSTAFGFFSSKPFSHHLLSLAALSPCLECNDTPNEENTLVFTLEVECTRNKSASDLSPISQRFNHATGKTIHP